jgi:hypothetical protein
MCIFKKFIALFVALGAMQAANASVIDFNGNNPNDYFIGATTSNGFTITNSPFAGENIGTTSNFDGKGQTNGTVYLAAWSNSSMSTGIVIRATDNSLFSMQSFDFDNAYASDPGGGLCSPGICRTASITVVGSFADTTTTSQTFSGLSGALTFQTLHLNTSFQNLQSVELTASGASNVRALYDNFSVNNVPEPETYVMMLVGLGLLGFVARRRKQEAE